MPKPKAVLYDPAKTFDDNFDHGPFPVDAEPYVNQGEPQFSFLGHDIYSPFGIAAGPLPTSRHIRYAFEQGFDVNVYKTMRTVPFQANAFPNVLQLDIDGDLTLDKASRPVVGRPDTDRPVEQMSITNSFGNPGRGPRYWVDDLKTAIAHQGPGQLLIISVCGTLQKGMSADDYHEDFAEAAALAAAAGAPAVELNLSCPNVASEGVLCYSRDAVVDICRRTKRRVGDTPLVAKFGYFAPGQQDLLQAIVTDMSPFVAAISTLNTITAPIVDEHGRQALPGPNRLKSGVCGASIKWAGLDMVRRLNTMREKLDSKLEIIGVGGVMTPADFQDYRAAGADLVQSATAAMWNPKLAAQIKSTLTPRA